MDKYSGLPPDGWMDAFPDPLLLVDGEGIVLRLNPAARRFLQETLEAGWPAQTLFDEETRATFESAWPEVLAGLGPARLAGETAGGFPVEATLARLPDAPPALILTLNDRSALRLVQAELRETRQKLAGVLDGVPLGLAFLDSLGRLVEVNDAWMALYAPPGQTRETLLGESLEPPLCPAEAAVAVPQALRGETFQYRDLPWQGRAVEVSGRPLYGPLGEVSGALVIFTESTAQEIREEDPLQGRALETVGLLAGGLARDFQTSMQSILEQVDQMRSRLGPLDALFGEFTAIESASRRALDLSANLLKFSHPESSASRPVNLNDLAREASSLVQSSLGGRASFLLELDPALPLLLGDPAGITHALLSLCLEAMEVMPHGGTIRLRTGSLNASEARGLGLEEAPGGAAWIAVKDEGPGVPPAWHADLTPSASGLRRSTRNGAALRAMIERHHAAMRVESQPGRGCTVALYFPAVPAGDSAIAERSISGLRGIILLVDDEPLMLKVGQGMLETGGYRVLAASNGAEALEIYRQMRSEIDLVVLDLVLPDRPGGEVLEQIRRLDPDARVLIASGFTTESGVREVLEGRADGFIQKPFRTQELLRKVAAVVSGADPLGEEAGEEE